MKELSSIQRANIEFHRLLAPKYENQPFFQESNRKRIRALLRELAQSTSAERLLDVGCGTGLILDLAHDIFREIDGIDITQEMLQRVKPRENVRTQLATAEKVPFPDNTFDAVTAYSVLHHIEDVSTVLREIRRVLKPGGFFYSDESPSQHYLDAFFSLDLESPMTSSVRRECEKIRTDANKYQELYGLSVETVQRAMAQNYSWQNLKQETLERELKAAGFDFVQIAYRRFVGEDRCREKGGEDLVNTIHTYLTEMLPLTRSMFKYFVLVAR